MVGMRTSSIYNYISGLDEARSQSVLKFFYFTIVFVSFFCGFGGGGFPLFSTRPPAHPSPRQSFNASTQQPSGEWRLWPGPERAAGHPFPAPVE